MNSSNYITKFFAFTMLTAIILVAAVSHINAAKGKNNRSKSKQTKLWQQIDESKLQLRAERSDLPEKYLVFRLNQKSLKTSLAEMPIENTNAAREESLVMEVPMADGTIQRFRMEETQVLSPELARQYPTWKTFVGYGIDDTKAIGRFDWNALGFHGYIETGKGTVLIDPYQKGDKENYLVFYKSDYGKSGNEFSCKVNNTMSKILKTDFQAFSPSAPQFSFGSSVRTYRLAVATTGEWSRNAAGFAANETLTPQQIRDNALAVVVTTVNRLNGIYVRELASTFQLVNPPTNSANNIIFDDPTTDPYDNSDAVAQLAVNQTTLDARVTTAGYDIGHLYGTGGGGVASSPSLCSSQKAEGYSARGTDTGDPFTVDYVAHEIGHQFGADHTYNNSDPDGACTTRSAADAFEVASGATIMSYVGICSARNLQQYVDTGFPSFHIQSLTTINSNLTNPNGSPQQTGCGTATGANAVPTVAGGTAYTIPKLTPFTVTATGGDADGGDVPNLLYSWEQYDLAPSASGASGTPPGTYDVDTDGILRPLFRVYSPVSSNIRTFPSLTFILNPANNDAAADVNGVRGNQPVLTYTGTHPTGFSGAVCQTDVTCVVGERLPTVSRTMNFRVSLRDRRGGVADAPQTVTVAGDAGPFQITTQNAAPAAWSAATSQTVTWDVAGTTANGIDTANVNILLSTDGGLTFPITLAANTPNDGTQAITVPNNPTLAARIKVEAVGNIFFDISNTDFTINQAAAPVLEADVASRPSGDGVIQSTDVVQVQRFQINLDQPNQSNEFQRADSAPFATRGDGVLQSDDVVQAQRYSIGLDAIQNAAGPTAPVPPMMNLAKQSFAKSASENQAVAAPREVRVESVTASAGQQVVVNLRADTFGDESAFGFQLNYDQTRLTFVSQAVGIPGSSRLCNTTVAGQITCSVNNFPDNQPGSSTSDIGEIPAGNNQLLLRITFMVAANAPAGAIPLTLSNVNASNDAAQNLQPITVTSGAVTVLAPTAASASASGRVVTAFGRGVSSARVSLTDQNGVVRMTRTNSFGYYRFNDIATGQSYVFNASHKRYEFAPRVVSIGENLSGLDFIAIN